ncbi:MAG: prohibitin family protein [Bacteroidetes bacterium]|nr:prohibitin family protein [Bacteroidota bacterium]MDA1181964.1 prohibitin family protein [Bacteroidota bacterium]
MKSIFILCAPLLLTQCAIIQPGEVGIKQRFGKLKGEPLTSGIIGYNPFIARVVKTSTQTNNLLLTLNLPSKEGLSVQADISILYHIDNNKFKQLLTQYGTDYEPIITAIFRSAASDVCAQYFAKDMHSGKRSDIENAINKKMLDNLVGTGMVVENVLMKSISLPKGLAASIEQKLQAEQDAMRMEFVLQQEKLEAERKIIEATGIRDAQLIQAQGLTAEILKIRSIDAFNRLSKSPNAKVIITDGKTPFLIND